MNAFRAVAAAAAAALALSLNAAAQDTTLRGYGPAESARERSKESQFLDIPSAESARETATRIDAAPHQAGTWADHDLAAYLRDRLRAEGLNADIESFTGWVDAPRTLRLELDPGETPAAGTPAERRRGRHREFPIGIDLAEAGQGAGLPFAAGSPNGDVIAPLVYADRGRDAEYDALGAAGVDVRGTVVVVRYGAQPPRLLAERAQTRGAAAVIFYSDPVDDGTTRGPVYPDGPWRRPTAVARAWLGWALRIPVLPVSAATALQLVRSLHGTPGPPGWGGTLPTAYPLGRGPGRVHLVVKMERRLITMWNVIGTIAGSNGDQSVIVGAHRDAWVYGAADGAGVETLVEVARGLGYLMRGGWQPQRTLVLAGWDGGIVGSVGSQAYAHAHRAEIARGCVAYLNVDQPVTGPVVGAAATAALAPLIVDATEAVSDPETPGASIYRRWLATAPHGEPHVDVPPDGGDAAVFAGETATPVATVRFSGPFAAGGSSDDTLAYATRFSDPDFTVHRAAAQLYGVVALRLADGAALPYTFSTYGPLLRGSLNRAAANAARLRIRVDRRPYRGALDRFAFAASAADQLSARAGPAAQLRAVHDLDVLVAGVSVLDPSDPARFKTAIRNAAAALEGVTADLLPLRTIAPGSTARGRQL
jgi:N-acetylated-alpha-linked acidic dipeptidase